MMRLKSFQSATLLVRRLIPSVLALTLVSAVLGALLTTAAQAETKVSSNISSNTTWSSGGSPYVLEKSINVLSGVTLTINPNVVVEFATATGTLNVEGSIQAVGEGPNEHEGIRFTSRAAETEGNEARGQYYGVKIFGGESRFSYATFLYGAKGSGGKYAYAVLKVNGGSVHVDHSNFESNEYSGLGTAGTASATVVASTFKHNGGGVSVFSPGEFNITDSHLEENDEAGVFVNQGSGTFPGAVVAENQIRRNEGYGVVLQRYCSQPPESFAHGEGNNIYENGTARKSFKTNGEANGSELYATPTCEHVAADWTHNYWGPVGAVVELLGEKVLKELIFCKGLHVVEKEISSSLQPAGALIYVGEDWPDRTKVSPGPNSTSASTTSMLQYCKEGETTFYYTEYTKHVYNSYEVDYPAENPFTIP